MAQTNPTDRDLNALLARVAGIELAEFRPGEWYCVANPADIASGSARWSPLHDANQMELVKAKLRDGGWHYMLQYNGCEHVVAVYSIINDDHFWQQRNPSELRAFALAVAAWWNEQKKEKAT